MNWRLFVPLSPPVINIRSPMFWVLVGSAIAGIGVGQILIKRGARFGDRTMKTLTLLLFGVAIVLQLCCIRILAVDPWRNTGTIPLPSFLKIIAEFCFAVVLVVGWFPHGVLVPFVISFARSRSWRWSCFAALVIIYSFWIFPWAIDVMYD